VNSINLTGRLFNDPELKKSPSGISYCRFILAVSIKGAKKGEQLADMIPCIAWKTQAETLAQYCHKGEALGLMGKLSVRPYEREGKTVNNIEVVVRSMEMLGAPRAKVEEIKPKDEPKQMLIEDIKTEDQDQIGSEDQEKSDKGDLPFEV
jgi:single-strand DNA-binding protein